MALPVVHGTWQEYERYGCPLIKVGGLEAVSLARVCEAFGLDRKAACKKLSGNRAQEQSNGDEDEV